jgi:hypothetical protein
MSFNYPVEPTQEDKDHYRDFVLSLRHTLPCGKCRKNLGKTFKRMPLTMGHMNTRESFSKYIYDLHEVVNTMLDKKSGLTYDEVRDRYEHFRARCAKPNRGGRRTQKKKTTEKGCTVPFYGKKARCLINIVPNDVKTETLKIDERCIKR